MQNVLSSRSRMERVVSDIVFDFGVKPRLSSQRGNAILVASSIYEACKYFELFQKTVVQGQVRGRDLLQPAGAGRDAGGNRRQHRDRQAVHLQHLHRAAARTWTRKPGKTKTETYEDKAKELFKEQPANMKLLVVVDKLLTGFDAPSCTYLYIDKSHAGPRPVPGHLPRQPARRRRQGLRLHRRLQGPVQEGRERHRRLHLRAGPQRGRRRPRDLLQDRLTKGRERLDNALEAVALLCEPVEPPKGELEHIHYFCGNTEIPDDLAEREPQRVALYKATVALVRAYANIADDLDAAGYSAAEIARIKQDVDRYLKLREIIRKASGETIDLKAYEADMRHLIDTYIEADEPRKISPFDDMALLELIVKSGHRRRDQQPARRDQGQQGRRRRDHREQRPQQDHQGAPERPGLLRPDVEAAGGDHRRPEGQAHRLRGVPEADRRPGEAGPERAGGRHARGSSRTAGAAGALQQPEG